MGSLLIGEEELEEESEEWMEYVDEQRGTYQLKGDKIRVMHDKQVVAEILIKWTSKKEFCLTEGIGHAKVGTILNSFSFFAKIKSKVEVIS